MKYEVTVKVVVPIMENGVRLVWTPTSEPDCRWYLADQNVVVDDSVPSVTINTPVSRYDMYDKSVKVFDSRQSAELYCAASGLTTASSLMSDLFHGV